MPAELDVLPGTSSGLRLYRIQFADAPSRVPLTIDEWRSGRFDGPIACVNDETEALSRQAIEDGIRELTGNFLILLVEPRRAPEVEARKDGPVTSFIAAGPWLDGLRQALDGRTSDFCYRALELALSADPGEVAIQVVHQAKRPVLPAPAKSVRVIVPHLGDDRHLAVCVAALDAQSLGCSTAVCFDQPPSRETVASLQRRTKAEIYAISPAPAGPYVIRQHFGLAAPTDYVAFQDSDDLALPGRMATLVAHAEASGADVVGCHELRFDELEKKVEAIRFPLDVNEALNCRTGHAQFFPTTLVRSGFFRESGGLSTNRRFGSDYQFLLRAHWLGRVVNADEFLYIRRRRANSLTTSRGTSLRSPARRILNWRWKSHFIKIKLGQLMLKGSWLRVAHTGRRYSISNLRSGREEAAVVAYLATDD